MGNHRGRSLPDLTQEVSDGALSPSPDLEDGSEVSPEVEQAWRSLHSYTRGPRSCRPQVSCFLLPFLTCLCWPLGLPLSFRTMTAWFFSRNMFEYGGWGLASPSCVLDPGWGGRDSSLPQALSHILNAVTVLKPFGLNSGSIGSSTFWTPTWTALGSPAQHAPSLGSTSGRWLCSARRGQMAGWVLPLPPLHDGPSGDVPPL